VQAPWAVAAASRPGLAVTAARVCAGRRRRRSQPGLHARRRGRRQQPLTVPSEGRGADQVTGRRL